MTTDERARMIHEHRTVAAVKACQALGCDEGDALLAAHHRERHDTIEAAQCVATRERRTIFVYWDNIRARFTSGSEAPWHATSVCQVKP